MCKISVVMPVYNVEKYVLSAIASVLNQSFEDFELIIVNDGSTDNSLSLCQSIKDKRILIINQSNRGLAGARNTGIRESRGKYVAFLDSDDLWERTKLESHYQHLENNRNVGVSFCNSLLIDESGNPLGITQSPKLKKISFKDIICRNPIGNGSVPVIRRTLLDSTSFYQYYKGIKQRSYFDEVFRQSEDIEYWLRIAIKSTLRFEGIDKNLTYYRVNSSGLSSDLKKQFHSWENAITKTSLIAPRRVGHWFNMARAYQLRYLCRRAVKQGNGVSAIQLISQAIRCDNRIFFEEPLKTTITITCASLACLIPGKLFSLIESTLFSLYRYIKSSALQHTQVKSIEQVKQ